MNAARRFKYHFTPKRLKELYNNKIIYRATVGMDRIIPTAFEKELDANIDIISRKVFSGTYTFTRYREILISKGRDKCPRVISIPTIRDKLALAAFHSVLQDTYNDIIEEPLLHTIIADIAAALSSGKYNSYVKVDITRFYSSINHDILLSKVKKKIHKKEILQFLKNAISTATVPEGVKLQNDLQNKKGVPEGLSISNILADIYLSELKACLQARYTIDYFRYVDDILILCDASDADLIKAEIMEILQKDYDLKAHEEKTVSGYLAEGVPYLGYVFYDNRIGVRSAAIQRIENSIETLFRLYKHGSISKGTFEWRLNLKIGGCIYEHKKYGWLFYYSQLTDLSELYHLDWFVNQMFMRFGLKKPNNLMRFVRAYHEITKNLNHSSYLINADTYTIEQKKAVLNSIYGAKHNLFNDEDTINNLFRRIMFREIQKLEHDIQNFS